MYTILYSKSLNINENVQKNVFNTSKNVLKGIRNMNIIINSIGIKWNVLLNSLISIGREKIKFYPVYYFFLLLIIVIFCICLWNTRIDQFALMIQTVPNVFGQMNTLHIYITIPFQLPNLRFFLFFCFLHLNSPINLNMLHT